MGLARLVKERRILFLIYFPTNSYCRLSLSKELRSSSFHCIVYFTNKSFIPRTYLPFSWFNRFFFTLSFHIPSYISISSSFFIFLLWASCYGVFEIYRALLAIKELLKCLYIDIFEDYILTHHHNRSNRVIGVKWTWEKAEADTGCFEQIHKYPHFIDLHAKAWLCNVTDKKSLCVGTVSIPSCGVIFSEYIYYFRFVCFQNLCCLTTY